MKRSRSYIDMLNDKLKEEPSTDPRVVSSYLKFIVMLDFLAVATVVPLLPQYFARSVRACFFFLVVCLRGIGVGGCV